MNQSEDAKYLASLKKRCKKASKKERGKILDGYVEITGYHRKYASAGEVGRCVCCMNSCTSTSISSCPS